MRTSRTVQLAALAATFGLALAACSAPDTDDGGGSDTDGNGDAAPAGDLGEVPETPSEPVTLNILDVAGNIKLTEGMIDSFVEEHPDVISSVTWEDRKSTRLNSSHVAISYAVFCLKKNTLH